MLKPRLRQAVTSSPKILAAYNNLVTKHKAGSFWENDLKQGGTRFYVPAPDNPDLIVGYIRTHGTSTFIWAGYDKPVPVDTKRQKEPKQATGGNLPRFAGAVWCLEQVRLSQLGKEAGEVNGADK